MSLVFQIGKIFSAVALIAAVAPMLTNPAIKTAYNASLATFPSAFLLLVAGLYAISALLCLGLWAARAEWRRNEVKEQEGSEEEMEELDENANAVKERS